MLDRIKALMAARQLSPSQFADQTTLPRPVVSHILSGRNKPSLEAVQKILVAYPDVSIDWLLNGRGEMFNSTPLNAPKGAPAPALEADPGPSTVSPTPSAEPQAPPAASKRTNAARAPRASVEPAASPQQPLEAATGPYSAQPTAPTPMPTPPNGYSGAQPGAYPPVYQQVPPQAVPPPTPPEYQPTYPPGYQPHYQQVVYPQTAPQGVPAQPGMSQGASNGALYPAPPVAAQQAVRPDKVVRRILVFYSDGTFSDHRPLSPEDNPFLW